MTEHKMLLDVRSPDLLRRVFDDAIQLALELGESRAVPEQSVKIMLGWFALGAATVMSAYEARRTDAEFEEVSVNLSAELELLREQAMKGMLNG